MARAFIASVPMGVVLVAALVVPLAVIPGTFAFERWPSSRGERITERQVRLPAPKVDVVAVRPRKVVHERHPVIVAARPIPVRAVPRTIVAVAAPPRHASVVRVSNPSPKPDPPRSSTPSAPAPHPAPPAPQQPTKNDSGHPAAGNAPVAREVAPPEAPTPAPAPAPAPVPAPAPPRVAEPAPAPAPVEREVPSEPGHGHSRGEGGQHGHGHSGD